MAAVKRSRGSVACHEELLLPGIAALTLPTAPTEAPVFVRLRCPASGDIRSAAPYYYAYPTYYGYAYPYYYGYPAGAYTAAVMDPLGSAAAPYGAQQPRSADE